MRMLFVSFLILMSKEPDSLYYARLRKALVDKLREEGITSERVLNAMLKVERHKFVPKELQRFAYQDRPLPIGYGQTISQPYVVALMTQLLDLKGDERVLEIGTGSGYQAAILSLLCKEVYTIEILKPLADSARERLKRLGYKNVYVKHGDGFYGWKEHSPYDAIIVTCAAPRVPEPLIEQLKMGGRLVIPEGDEFQVLNLYIKTEKGLIKHSVIPVRFVPMRGKIRE